MAQNRPLWRLSIWRYALLLVVNARDDYVDDTVLCVHCLLAGGGHTLGAAAV